jgi:hypothetical protein
LEQHAVISGIREAHVLVLDDDGQSVTIAHRLNQLRGDPRYSSMFPQPPTVEAKNDFSKLRANFDDIASGKVIVTG